MSQIALLLVILSRFGKDGAPVPSEERARLAAQVKALKGEIVQHYQQDRAREALRTQEHVLALQKRLYPARDFPQGHPELATSLNNLGFLLQTQGEEAKALPCFEQALAMYHHLYPKERYPQGHPDLAATLNNLGGLWRAQGEYDKALTYFEQCLAMLQRLYPKEQFPKGQPYVTLCLCNLGHVSQDQREYARAFSYFKQALAILQQLYPKERYPQGHSELADCIHMLGFLSQEQVDYDNALVYFEQALTMRRQLYPKERFPRGHPELAASLNSLGGLLMAQGEYGKALANFEQALAMRRQLYPKDHLDLAASLNNLGLLLQQQGEYGKALPYFEQTVAMCQRLFPKERYPRGQPDLATSMNMLGTLLATQGEFVQARPYFEQALAMRQQIYFKERYPWGHHHLANSLTNLGLLLKAQQEYAQALSYLEQALIMRRQLYPKERYPQGHPELAQSLHNLGGLRLAQGENDKALSYQEQALAMYVLLYPKKYYPQGHPHLASSLDNLAVLLRARGEYEKALPYYEQALAMYRRLGESFASQAAEAEALAFLRSLPLTRDGYLSVTAYTSTPAAVSYAQVWQSRAALSRLLQRRHQSTRVALAGSEKARHTWQELLDTRRRLARLLLDAPVVAHSGDGAPLLVSRSPDRAVSTLPGANRLARDQELARLSDRKESLERELAGLVPELQQAKELNRLGPADLARLLPPGAALVDLVQFTYFGKAGASSPRYVAFVVRSDQTIRRVELPDALRIDAMVRSWRQAIDRLKNSPEQAADVARLVWEPIARELPSDTTTIYVAPDGELTRLPWAALPGKKAGTVLLEDVTIALVPHGPFLLEQLKFPSRSLVGPQEQTPSPVPETVLALGNVAYGPASKDGYEALPGSAAEIQRLLALAGSRRQVVLAREQATWSKLRVVLPQARFAHLATHGFFQATALSHEEQRLERQRKTWEFQADRPTARVGLGLRSPLSYTGLVLAGANRPSAAEDGGLVTGEDLVELPLEGLRLCVLSACETGLGDLGPLTGEGAQGLERAFHLAGCPNVIASRWQVDDQATAALMAKFYHELWTNGKSPLAALREAQLTILRHPERIAVLANRAAPNTGTVIRLSADGPAPRRAPTKLWAAFVLSGVGQ